MLKPFMGIPTESFWSTGKERSGLVQVTGCRCQCSADYKPSDRENKTAFVVSKQFVGKSQFVCRLCVSVSKTL